MPIALSFDLLYCQMMGALQREIVVKKRLNQKQPEVSKIGRLQSMQSQTCRKNMFQHSLQPPSRSGSHRTSVMRSSSCETDQGHLAMRAMASLVLDSNTDLSGIWMDKILLPMQCVFIEVCCTRCTTTVGTIPTSFELGSSTGSSQIRIHG